MAAIQEIVEKTVGKTKVRIINFTKLAVAVGTLAAAVNGYVQVRKDQNNLLETVSDKLNAITLKVAYLEGRIEGLSARDARRAAEHRVRPAPEPAAALPQAVEPPVVVMHGPESAIKTEDDKVYQKMPSNFAALQMVVDQKVLEVDKLPPTAAAPNEVGP